MKPRDVVIVSTGTANMASVMAAFARLGCRPRTAIDRDDVIKADRLVLPGVGSFGAAADSLRTHGLDEAIRRRIEVGRPLLAVCVGMQLLAEASEESPGARGLGVIPGMLTRFTGVRTPQFGWNFIRATERSTHLRSGYAYFANSYRLTEIPSGWIGATAEYGGSFVAAIERESILACQFHPELSGDFGMNLLERWLEQKECAAC